MIIGAHSIIYSMRPEEDRGFASEAGTRDTGKFVLALRRVKGKWLIAADMDNGNSRPPRP